MKILQTTTAVVELGTGLALLACPSVVVKMLLGSPLDAPAAVALGRVTGTALLALGIACWLARGDANSRTARGLVAAMLLYNLATAVILTFAGAASGLVGIALWPAVVLHAAMTIWCIACLRCRAA